MENKRKKRSRIDNGRNRLQNTHKNDNILKKILSITIMYAIIAITILASTGCTNYKQLYVEEVGKTQAIRNNCITALREETNRTQNTQMQLEECNKKNMTTTKTITKIINNSEINKKEIQRYANELQWCKIRLTLINNTDYIDELKRNYTNTKLRLTECNSTLNDIREVV